MGTDAARSLTRSFVERLKAGDFDNLHDCLQDNVRLRALVPDGLRNYEGREASVAALRKWFGDPRSSKVLDSGFEPIGDRGHVWYRIRVDISGEPYTVEQHFFCDVGPHGIVRIDLLCSGFLPEPKAVADDLHLFDAEELGCADGLAKEFRRHIRAIPIGDSLRVLTTDPAAKEELPPLARMMGHKVLSVEAHDDARLSITVERGA